MNNRKPILGHPLIRAGAKVAFIRPEVLAGDCLAANIVLHRHRAIMAGHLMGLSYAELARIFARDHKTISAAIKTKPQLAGCPSVRAIIGEAERLKGRQRGQGVVPKAGPKPGQDCATRRPTLNAVPTEKHTTIWRSNSDVAAARLNNIHRW